MWVGTLPAAGSDPAGLGFNPDQFTRVFGHEVAELMTDYSNNGFEVSPGMGWAGSPFVGTQIGDNEGAFYTYRLSDGQLVQPLWSRADNAWVVDDGLANIWNFTGNLSNPQLPVLQADGEFALTLNGDQLGPNANDLVVLGTDPQGGAFVYFDGDIVNFDPNYLSGITLNLGGGQNTVIMQQGLPPGVTLTMNAAGGSINLTGPEQSDFPYLWQIAGPGGGQFSEEIANASNYMFSDVANITGSAAGDHFEFYPDGGLSGNLDGGGTGGGVEEIIDFTHIANTLPALVNLENQGIPQIGGTFHDINRFVGNSNPLTVFFGPDANSTWTFGAGGNDDVNGVAFTSFANVFGGTGDDTFTFLPGGSVAGNLVGGGGTNTLDYSALVGPVTVDFSNHTATDIGGTFANIQNVIGSQSPNDTIIGPDAAWIINGANSGSVDGITFSSFENLQGSGPTNTFAFEPGGSIAGTISGSPGGTNTLDFSALPGPVSIDPVAGTAPGLIGAFTGITTLLGGPGGFVVAGGSSNTPTTWTITAPNTISALGFTFTNTPSITGGPGSDTFRFLPGGSLSGRIDGGGGIDTLDDSQLTTNVVVDLALHSATGVAGGVFNVENVIGGKADNLLVGDGSSNVLVGGLGRNVLIGDGGSDQLVGGLGDNLLIGDTTVWDTNLTALMAIFAEWTRLDQSFARRISDLIKNGRPGLNGPYTLTTKTVLPDGSINVLVGGLGRNWFFQAKRQDILIGEDDNKDRVTQL